MGKATVVVFSSRSLFAAGVSRRLQTHSEALDLRIVDVHSKEALEQIIALAPQAVILDASDREASQNCPIQQLLAALPTVRIIRLDPEQAGFQVVTSTQHFASHIDELLEVITYGPQAD